MRFFDIHIVGIVSSVSARKLKCPGSAWYFHSSARLEPENSSSNSSLVNSPFITLQTMAFNHNSFQWFKSASNVFSLLNRKFRTHFGISILFDFLKVWGYRLQEKIKNKSCKLCKYTKWGYILSIFILSIWKPAKLKKMYHEKGNSWCIKLILFSKGLQSIVKHYLTYLRIHLHQKSVLVYLNIVVWHFINWDKTLNHNCIF